MIVLHQIVNLVHRILISYPDDFKNRDKFKGCFPKVNRYPYHNFILNIH